MDKCAICGKKHGIMYASSYDKFVENGGVLELICVDCFDKIGETCSHLPLSFLIDSLDSLVAI